MTGRAEPPTDPRFATVIDAFARDRRVTSGTMMASVGLKVDGKIFAMLVRGRLVLKLPASRVSEMVAAGAGEHFDANKGTPMKEWLSLDPQSAEPWLPLAREALDFAGPARR